MRALPAILAARPTAHAVIVGGDSISYGAAAPAGQTWKEIFLSEVRDRIPLSRVHFVGKIPYVDYVSLLQVSAAHIYLTYPFVLSWSMLEAMSAGAPLIASSTPPVLEVVEQDVNGVLVDFFDVDGLAQIAIDVLAHPHKYFDMRKAGRKTIVESYDPPECGCRNGSNCLKCFRNSFALRHLPSSCGICNCCAVAAVSGLD